MQSAREGKLISLLCRKQTSKKILPNLYLEMITFFRTEMNMNISVQIASSYPNRKYKVESFTLLVSLRCLTRLWVCYVKTVHYTTSPEALRSFVLVFFNTIWREHFQIFSILIVVSILALPFLVLLLQHLQELQSLTSTLVWGEVFCNLDLEDCNLDHESKDIGRWVWFLIIFGRHKITNLQLEKVLSFSGSVFFSYHRLSSFPL